MGGVVRGLELRTNISKIICKFTFLRYICTRKQAIREFSSAGSEHLPYKQRVGGSNPSTPTVLELMGLDAPAEMTGEVLVEMK